MHLVATSAEIRGKTILADSHFQIIYHSSTGLPALLARRIDSRIEIIKLDPDSHISVKASHNKRGFSKLRSPRWKQLPHHSLLGINSKLTVGIDRYTLCHRPKKLDLTPPRKNRIQLRFTILPIISMFLLLSSFFRSLSFFNVLLPLTAVIILLGAGTHYWVKRQKPPRADELYLALIAKKHLFQQNISPAVKPNAAEYITANQLSNQTCGMKTYPTTGTAKNPASYLPQNSPRNLPYAKPVNIPTDGLNLWLDRTVININLGDFLCFYGSTAKNTAAWCAAQLLCYYPNIFSLNLTAPGKTPIYLDSSKNLRPVSAEVIYLTWADTENEIPPWCTHIYPQAKKIPSWQWWLDIKTSLCPDKNLVLADRDSRLITNIPSLFSKTSAAYLPASKGTVSTGSIPLAQLIYQEWQYEAEQKNSLSTILGLHQGQQYWLDLVKSGPHMLLAGTTGSGKSTALQAFILGLALRYSPENLSLILVDYKGGEAFEKFAHLPHCAGVLTNLKAAETQRALSSLLAEIKYRESIPSPLKSLPRILLIVDEFRILAKDHPEIMETIIRLSILGRSLGIHIVLATQQPSGCVDHQIRANTAIRLSLKMLSASDSQEVLGISGAESLAAPGEMMGIVDDQQMFFRNLWIADEAQIEKLNRSIIGAWSKFPSKPLRLPWAAPLPEKVMLPAEPAPNTKLHLGIGDFPDRQKLEPLFLKIPFALQITASPNSGQSELIRLLAVQLLQRGLYPIHLLTLKPVPFLSLLPEGEKWPGHLGTDAQSIAEILRINDCLQGIVLIEDIHAITQLLERTYHRYHYFEEFANLCNQAGQQRLSLAVSCLPNQSHSRIFQALDSRLVGFLRDSIQAAQLGISPKALNLLDRPGKFLFQSNVELAESAVVLQPYTAVSSAEVFHPENPILQPDYTSSTGFIRALPEYCNLTAKQKLGVGLYGALPYPPLPLVLVYDDYQKQQAYLENLECYYHRLAPPSKIADNRGLQMVLEAPANEAFFIKISLDQWRNGSHLEIEQCFNRANILFLGNVALPNHLIDLHNSEAASTVFPAPPGRATLISQKIMKAVQLRRLVADSR